MAFNRQYSDAVNRALPKYLADAAADLTPAVDRVIKRLATAAAKLPAGSAALDPETNIANDSGGALQEARACLTLLAQAASIHQGTAPGMIPVALNNLLPIVDLPEATVEEVKASIGESVVTTNEEDLGSTRTIRKLNEEAKDNTDLVLVDIARGAYPGVKLALATPQQMNERKANAKRAYQRMNEWQKGALVL